MSECVVPIEKPKTCKECFDKYRCFGTGEYFQDGTIWCGIAKGYLGEITKCPIIAIPEGHGRLVDAEKLKAKKYHSNITHENAVAVAEIDWAETIVPAERRANDGTD